MIDPIQAIKYVISHEGGLVDNPSDPGGITNFGISARFLTGGDLTEQYRKAKNYEYDDCFARNPYRTISDFVKEMKEEMAIKIYKNEFWPILPFDKLLRQTVANYLFDTTVNMGAAEATKIAQRACNDYFRKRLLVDDGVFGDKTLEYVNQLGFSLLPTLIAERCASYRLIAETNPNQKQFLNGWLNRAYCG